MITVRLATYNDVRSIVRMGRAFWAAIPYSDVPYCPDSLAATCQQMIAQGLLVYAEIDGHSAGALGALASPLFVNRDYLVAAELFWWVEPQHRNSGVGKLMFRELETAAKAAGVYRLSMMAVEGLELEKAAVMYERSGYSATERTWNKRLWPQ